MQTRNPRAAPCFLRRRGQAKIPDVPEKRRCAKIEKMAVIGAGNGRGITMEF